MAEVTRGRVVPTGRMQPMVALGHNTTAGCWSRHCNTGCRIVVNASPLLAQMMLVSNRGSTQRWYSGGVAVAVA